MQPPRTGGNSKGRVSEGRDSKIIGHKLLMFSEEESMNISRSFSNE